MIEQTSSGASFTPDGSAVVYTTVDDKWRPDTVWLHRLGASRSDERIFHEPDERFWVGAGFTRSDAYLLIGASSSVTSGGTRLQRASSARPHRA